MIASLLLAALLPAHEMAVVNDTATRYGLDAEGRALLIAIRRAENGPRLHYGVVDTRCNGYAAQCAWAANTIRLRYTGDVEKFAKRWCPNNHKVWSHNVKWFLRKQGVRK